MTTRAFVSFDYDYDETLKTFLIGQSKNPDSPFELSDWSIKEHITHNWKDKARSRIRAVDVVIVLCGAHTASAAGVAAELSITQEERKPYFLLKGYSQSQCQKPTTATSDDKIYNWTWDNLRLLIGGSR